MLACHAWLGADFFVSRGYRLESADGRRWAVRGSERHEIEAECDCGPDVCPPHETTYLTLKEAA